MHCVTRECFCVLILAVYKSCHVVPMSQDVFIIYGPVFRNINGTYFLCYVHLLCSNISGINYCQILSLKENNLFTQMQV